MKASRTSAAKTDAVYRPTGTDNDAISELLPILDHRAFTLAGTIGLEVSTGDINQGPNIGP